MQEYRDVFGPLILEECLALMQRGQVEETDLSVPYRCITGESSEVNTALIAQLPFWLQGRDIEIY